MAVASPDGELPVLLLEPLGEQDILDILRSNHGVEDPEAFVHKASEQGVDGLLSNPQTLGLLAQAVRGEQWPATRQQTFELACEQLAEEASEQHRDKLRSCPLPVDKLLEAAGQLCAALLLAEKPGIALDRGSADVRFPALEEFSPPDLEMAAGAVQRKLFMPSASREERVEPIHRSIAEFLAARWLAMQVDDRGLPLGRVLNLLLGTDGRTVAGLRGLYGWLALHCHAARSLLIDADPLTVVIYGDAKPMPRLDKQRILAALGQEAERHTAFGWQVQRTQAYGSLADPELSNDFAAILNSPERGDAAQAFASCVLEILAQGERLPELATTVLAVVADETRWGRVRTSALSVWIKLDGSAQEALTLLDAISGDKIVDSDDELAGMLLHHLYPKGIQPEDLPRYLHRPKNQRLFGSYASFWDHEFPIVAPKPHLPILLDQLAGRTDLPFSDPHDIHLRQMISSLLSRGVVEHGKDVSSERLFAWLGIGADKFGHFKREMDGTQVLADWLTTHPERYKELLALCFEQCAGKENLGACLVACEHRLHRAAVPEDIGLWHLEQASTRLNDALAEQHVLRALRALEYKHGATGLTQEKIEAWGEDNPARKKWLTPTHAQEIREWREWQIEHAAQEGRYKQEHSEKRRALSQDLNEQMAAIRNATASPALMHDLADVWLNRFRDTPGETPLERFERYCDDGAQVLAAAESGFRQCVERNDLPTVAEIIALCIKQREHLIRQPCLLGMDLSWRDGETAIDALGDETLCRMVAFRLTYGIGNSAAWLNYLARRRARLVAGVLIEYANAALKSRQEVLNGSYEIAHDRSYCEVARIAVPQLLERFPLRVKAGQLRHLEHLLSAALGYSVARLPELVEKKTSAKSMDVAQKVYWLAAAMLLDPEKHEAQLWGYIGNSWTRANYLAGFLSERSGGLSSRFELSPRTIGKLIELLSPHAELDWPAGGGLINDAMRRGDQIRSMVTRLGALGTGEATQEVERLLALPTLNRLKFSLEDTRHQLCLQRRESAFRFPPLAAVAQILANREPTSAADLATLVLDHLDDIARDIRTDNDDGFRAFWNVENRKPPSAREENLCRDALLTRLKPRLKPFGVECLPEVDHSNDKRADISVSYRNQFACPIEVKGEWHPSLWTALRSQLIEQYAIGRRAAEHGIYLVLWFGGERLGGARDGGNKPRSPEELRDRLQAQLDPVEQKRIFVRVLDVSWPAKR
jgi:hypothetical protein